MGQSNDSEKIKDGVIPEYSKKKCFFAQVVVALALGFFNVNLGLIFSITTIAIGGLLEEKESFHINFFEASWFGSIPFITLSIGSIIAGFTQDLIGRKGSALFAHVPAVLGWVLLYYSNSITILYSSAAVLGLSVSLAQSPLFSYSGEVFQPKLRGTLSSIQGIFFNIGFIAAFLLGALYKWRTAVGLCTCMPIITFFMILMIPESPVWLAQKNKIKKSKASLCWLRGWTQEVYIQDEWNTIMKNIIMTNNNVDEQLLSPDCQQLSENESDIKQNKATNKKPNSLQRLEAFFSPAVQKPLLLLAIYFLCAFCVSLIQIKPVIISILLEMKVAINPNWFMVVSSVIQLVGAIAFSLVLKRFGKRLITIFCFTIAILTCFGLGFYDFLGNYGYLDHENSSWIPITLFSVNSFIATFGITTIPWILVSEIFPLEFRGLASGVSTALCNVMTFCTTKTYINAKQLLGLSGSFVMYGVIGLFGLIYLYFKLPETEGKTIHDIESSFKVPVKRKKTCVEI